MRSLWGALARLAVLLLAAGAALLRPDTAHAVVAPPTLDSAQVTLAYYGTLRLSGQKPDLSVIRLEHENGDELPCPGGQDPMTSTWTCSVDTDRLFPRPPGARPTETFSVYAVDTSSSEISSAAPVVVTYAPSRFAVTSSSVLPAGDSIVLEGQREQGYVEVDWTIEGPSGPLLAGPAPCEAPDPDRTGFTCRFVDRTPRSAGAPAPGTVSAKALPAGGYTATLHEYLSDLGVIDTLTFEFAILEPPLPPAPTSSPSFSPPPKPTSSPTPHPSPGPDPGPSPGPEPGPDPGPDPTPGPGPAPPPTEPTELPPDPVPPASESTSPSPGPVDPDRPVAARRAPVGPGQDILRLLLLAVLGFTILALVGRPGLALGGRFAPGSTRTGAGARLGGGVVLGGGAALGLVAGSAVDGVDDPAETAVEDTVGRGDRSLTWRAPGVAAVDRLGFDLPRRLAPRWPLLARLVADATPLRAALGSLSLLVPAGALALGALAATGADADRPTGTGVGLVAVLLVVGLLDAAAGALALAGYSLVLLASVGPSVVGSAAASTLRGLLAIAMLWCLVSLLAAAARPLRRIRAAGQSYLWDRAADTAIAALVCGWAVDGLVGGLDDLVGRPQPLTEHAHALGLLTIAAVVGRFLLEELVARAYPRRLRAVHDPRALGVEPSVAVQARVLAVRVAGLVFVAWALLGGSWQLGAMVAVFALPQVLALTEPWWRRTPGAARAGWAVPSGVTQTLLLVAVGVALAYLIEAHAGADRVDALRTGVVLLALPASVLGVLEALAPERPEPPWTWPRQLAGAAVVLATVLLVLVVG